MKPWEKYADSTSQEPQGPWTKYQSNSEPQIAPQTESDDGFLDRVQSNYDARVAKGNQIADAYVRGDQTKAETLAQFGGQGVAIGGDVVAEAMKSVGSGVESITPEPLLEYGRDWLDWSLNNPVMRPITDAAKAGASKVAEGYSSFAEDSPRAARNLEAAANIGLSLGPFAPIKGTTLARPAATLAEEGISNVAKGASSAAKGIGNAMIPSIDEGLLPVAMLAQKYEIPVSVTQLSPSPALKNVEKISKELPFSGAEKFRELQMRKFNEALLSTVGGQGNRVSPEVMDDLFAKAGADFDKLGRGKSFAVDDNFINSLSRIEEDALGAANFDAQKNFQNAVGGLMKEIDRNGSISGEKLAFQRARINRIARKTSNPDTRELLRDLENVVIDIMTESDDVAREALSGAKQRYKNLLVIEPLAQKAKGGNISPTQLHTRVGKIYGRQYTRGKAGNIGELARIGNEILPELGGSDTAQKVMYGMAGGAALGSGGTSIAPTAMLLGGNRLYQSAANRNQALVKQMTMKELAKLPPREAQRYLNRNSQK